MNIPFGFPFGFPRAPAASGSVLEAIQRAIEPFATRSQWLQDDPYDDCLRVPDRVYLLGQSVLQAARLASHGVDFAVEWHEDSGDYYDQRVATFIFPTTKDGNHMQRLDRVRDRLLRHLAQPSLGISRVAPGCESVRQTVIDRAYASLIREGLLFNTGIPSDRGLLHLVTHAGWKQSQR